MATKKAVSSGKKSVSKSTASKPATKVTTVKAVSSPSRMVGMGLAKSSFIGALIAEFIGTFILSAAFIDLQGSPLYVAFIVVGIVLVFGGLSGAHINPAVTVGAWFTKKISATRAVGYVVAQVLGAGVSFAVLSGFLKATKAATGAAAPSLYHAATLITGKEWYIFFAELLGTAIVGFSFATALSSQKDKLTKAFTIGFGLLIGLALAVSASSPLLTAASTGFSVLNPAIAMSLNALDWNFWPIFIYVFAPLLGGVIGFLLHDFLKVSDGGLDA